MPSKSGAVCPWLHPGPLEVLNLNLPLKEKVPGNALGALQWIFRSVHISPEKNPIF